MYMEELQKYFYFIERRIFAQNYKFSNESYLLCTWRDFQKILCDVYKYYKWNFKSKFSPIYYFDLVTDVWIAPILCVKPPLSLARKCIKKVKFSSLWVKIFKPPVLRVTITVSYNIVAYSFKQLYFCAHDNTYEFCLCIENNLNFAKRFWFTSESEEPIWFMLSRFRLC